MMSSRMIRRIFDLEWLVEVILSQVNPKPQVKPKSHQETTAIGTFDDLPPADKALIEGLMMQLSDESNPDGRKSAIGDIPNTLRFYETKGYDMTRQRTEYLLRRQGLPYMRPGFKR